MNASELTTDPEKVMGIDLGGTAIKLGLFDRQGHCHRSITVATPQPARPEPVFAAMLTGIAQLDPHGEAIAIGVGTPGPVDSTRRIARISINLEGWQDIPLADWLTAKVNKPIILENDANCAGLGEAWLGAGRPFQDFILLTLGTGVGGAIFLNGNLFVGHAGAAGELGLITYQPDGPPCNSGNNGSLEQYASIGAIRRQTGLDPAELGARAQQGDGAAIAFWQTYGRTLAVGLTSLVYVLTPEAILIGGGICASFDYFLPSLRSELERRTVHTSRTHLKILPAQLGNQAGIVGAAKLAWQSV